MAPPFHRFSGPGAGGWQEAAQEGRGGDSRPGRGGGLV